MLKINLCSSFQASNGHKNVAPVYNGNSIKNSQIMNEWFL